MARPSSTIAFNLGMQTASAAVFQHTAEGGLELLSYRSSELIVDPAADATRNAQIEAVSTELRSALNLPKKFDATLCLPSQSVFTRFVKLPGAAAEDVASIIPFEAQQNVPFPIDEVVWDAQILGQRRGETWDVALVAIKSDQLGGLVQAAGKGGFNPGIVEFAPTALFNAFRFNYPEATGCTLLIDIGSRTTNLIFIDNDRFFSRTIPIGGNTISAAIAKEFEQDITLAEKLKIEKGIVGLGGAYAEPEDATTARISKVVRNTMTRLHAEIARSVNFHRTSHGGVSPQRILLTGAAAGMPYTIEFFAEKLQLPVGMFNPLRNVRTGPGAIPDGVKTSGLAELVGCATRSLQNCPVEINLLPPEVRAARETTRKIPRLALAALFLIATPVLWWLHLDRQATRVSDESATLAAEASRKERLAQGIATALVEKDALALEAAPFLLVATERSAWTSILDELADMLPDRFIWVTQLKPVTGPITPPEPKDKKAPPARPGSPAQPRPTDVPQGIVAIEINGLYLDNPPNSKGAGVIDEFFANLKPSAVFAIGDDMAQVITKRTTPTGEAWAYDYTLLLPLKQPIRLP